MGAIALASPDDENGRPIQPSSYTRRQWRREHANVVWQEHLNATIKELRLAHAYKMQSRVIEMHVALGERIEAQSRATDNPLIREALKRSYDSWLRRAEELLA
jgi:hypothetical protein